MGLQPKIERKAKFTLKTCACCGSTFGAENFVKTKSVFYPDGVLPFCSDCIDEWIYTAPAASSQTQTTSAPGQSDPDWSRVNRVCQWADIPFVPREWVKIYEMNPNGAFARYAAIFEASEYDDIGWHDYYNEYKKLEAEHKLETELPGIKERRLKEQRDRWGQNYDEEALEYLEGLFNGLLTTQTVNGALQMDQALKICKLSYEIDCRIREGAEFDKVLSAYDKLVKTAEFTPKNVKNVNDFETVGELIKWLEKKGWRNKYYDNVSRDIVDETIKNIQSFNQRLYTNESGLGDEITRRIEMLQLAGKAANSLPEGEGYYLENKTYDLDNYVNDGYEELIKNQVFDPNVGADS